MERFEGDIDERHGPAIEGVTTMTVIEKVPALPHN